MAHADNRLTEKKKMKPNEQDELIELLNKCWMTHDGMWFYHCFQKFGIQQANKTNKAAIQSLAPIEVARIKKFLGMGKESIDTFDAFIRFFKGASELFIPDFMNAYMNFPQKNTMHWEFKPKQCFAYKGMQRIGALDEYECGVIYRIECWIKSLGISYEISPKVTTCLMRDSDFCYGDFTLQIK
jgi:hypothetical protein